MAPTEPADDAAVFDFLDEFLRDLERGTRHPLTHYLARFPGREEAIAAEYFAELERSGLASPSGARGPAPVEREDPQRVGPYRLLRELGRGGQGAVWLAEDTRFARNVALKLLPAEFAALSHERRRRLQREAEVIARLDHPCLCAVLEARVDGERPYIAMRFVEGATLGEWIVRAREARKDPTVSAARGQGPLRPMPRNSLELAKLLTFFERTARALHAAHEAGVVHRDVKPQNLMVSRTGDPVVLDFGQARDETSDSFELTRSGDVLGTPAYMSPEQVLGRRDGIDRRTDVWSLGATLYEALTLERPFRGDSVPALFHSVREEPAIDVRVHNSAVPADLAVVVATALEKDPARRYATALDLAEDLRRVREYEPVRARPPSTLRVFRGWVRRHPALALSTVGSIVALSIGLAGSLYLLSRERLMLEHALGRHLAQRCEDLIQEDPSAALAVGIEAVRSAETYQTRRSLLLALQACYLRSVVSAAPAHRALSLALSPDGRGVALGYDQGTLRIADVESGASRVETSLGSAGIAALRYSIDGARVASAGGERATLLDSKNLAPLWSVPFAGETLTSIDFFDGDRKLCVRSQKRLRALDVRDGSTLWQMDWGADGSGDPRLDVHAGVERAVVWRRAPAGRDRSTLELIDLASGASITRWDMEGSTGAVAFRPDGASVAAGGDAGWLHLWRSSDGQREASHRNPGAIKSVRFAPDGRRLVALVDEGNSTRAWIWYLDSGARVPLASPTHTRLVDAAFSPDGERLASVGTDMVVRLWDASNGRAQRGFRGRLAAPREVAWTADGERLLSVPVNGDLQVWYAGARPDVYSLRSDESAVTCARFSPDGERALVGKESGLLELWSTPSLAGDRMAAPARLPGRRLHAMSHRKGLRDAVFSPDGASMASVAADGAAVLWDVASGARTKTLHEGESELVQAAFSADGATLAIRARDGAVFLCGTASAASRALDVRSPASACAWVGSTSVLAVGHSDGVLRLFDSRDARMVGETRFEGHDGRSAAVAAIAVRADGSELALSCADGRARFFLPDGQRSSRETLVLFPPQSIAYDRAGTRLFATGSVGIGALRLVDLARGQTVRQDLFQLHTGDLTGGAFSPDGRFVITTAKDGGAHVRSALDGSPVAHFPGPGGACFLGSISPPPAAARALVAFEDGSVWVWPLDPLAPAIARLPRELGPGELEREQRLALPLRYEPHGRR